MNKDKRELTADEAKRNEFYEQEKAGLEKEGYKAHDLTTTLIKSNTVAVLVVLPMILIFGLVYFLVNKVTFAEFFAGMVLNSIWKTLLYLVGIFLLVVIHELIHGVTRAAFAKRGWKSVSFGFVAKFLTPYCACNEPLKKFGYILGALMPTIVLGVIPTIVSIVIGNSFLFLVGAIMILSGSGDVFTTLLILKFKTHGKEALYLDHPYLVGLTAFVKE